VDSSLSAAHGALVLGFFNNDGPKISTLRFLSVSKFFERD